MVDTNLEELNAKIQKHRRRVFLRGAGIVAAVIMGVILLELWTALRNFTSFEIRNTDKFTLFSFFRNRLFYIQFQ